ncbi:MAG: hypothetical protein M3O09_16290 [Acidobacteriota bacterium]|nr:hypothetical protein [Acidobacteriota bacterium]
MATFKVPAIHFSQTQSFPLTISSEQISRYAELSAVISGLEAQQKVTDRYFPECKITPGFGELARTAKPVPVQVLEKKYQEQSQAPVSDSPQEQHRDRSWDAARGLVWVPARVLEGFFRKQ